MIPPKGMVQLWAWIQCSDDRSWWACIGWTAHHDDSLVLCTGYAAPADVLKKYSEDYQQVPRLRRAGPPEVWPAPAPIIGEYRWTGPHHHYGRLDGSPLGPPEPAHEWLWLTRS
jgi:hypothetical protein